MIEPRIFDAALNLYGRQGWLGFSLDGVARGAGVSKDAMYRRWKSREDLLRDALHECWDWVATIDEGDVRGDLLQLVARTFETFTGQYGEVALQLRADARRFSEVRAFAEPYRESIVLQGRRIVRSAIQRGDLPGSVNPGIIMDLLIGSVINHVVSTPLRLKQEMVKEGPNFLSTIVDIVLVGVHQVNGKQKT